MLKVVGVQKKKKKSHAAYIPKIYDGYESPCLAEMRQRPGDPYKRAEQAAAQ